MKSIPLLWFLALAPALAGAQICTGLAPFERGPVHALAGVSKMHGAVSVDGGVAIGGRRVFGQLSVGRNSIQDREGAALEIAGTGGLEFPGGPRETVRVCLLGAFSVVRGPRNVLTEDPAGAPMRADFTSVDWSVGVAAGAARSFTRRPLLLPTGSVWIVSTMTRTRNQSSGAVGIEPRVFGIMEAGVGIVLARTITVRPMLTIPVGLRRASYGASVIVSTALGGRKRPNGTRL